MYPYVTSTNSTNISDFNQSALQHFLALDYAPSLKNMAYLESIAEKPHNDNETGDTLIATSSLISTRRQTTNGPKGREHYFDKILKRNCSSSSFSLNGEMGKVSGGRLADFSLINTK